MKRSNFYPCRFSVHNFGYPETKDLMTPNQNLEKTRKGILLTATGLHKFMTSQDPRKDSFQDLVVEILISPEDGSQAQVHCFTPEFIVTAGVPERVIISPFTKVSFCSDKNFAEARKILVDVLKKQCEYHEVSNY